ncbi:hypothetical protein A2392_03270 [Candidatus Kaiserbacteria bacterium RIFOXYB1_FULL_46_14]|uniref:Uncharacterized protein n=1 Tax=Candidatus Kaiserbacteria bacterium RIFOXYB1_FULL_46_14 TaxID=1798531 RepID=A0A1F6FI00_9BACT|nr:MAG: hypothetical protein A2392_03270 [Candidatus Kaiserbacteria bacterium RIFOXYB1_FULL_46_14]
MVQIKILWGGTRFVFLVGDCAYKLARVRIARAILQLIRHTVTGHVRERLDRFGRSPHNAIYNYFLAGVIANREEYYISCRYEDVAQVYSVHLWGLLSIQKRGESLSPLDINLLRAHPLWEMILRNKGGDKIEAVKQFAKFGPVIKLVDAGRCDLDPGMFP